MERVFILWSLFCRFDLLFFFFLLLLLLLLLLLMVVVVVFLVLFLVMFLVMYLLLLRSLNEEFCWCGGFFVCLFVLRRI